MSIQKATTKEKPITIADVATPEPTKTMPSALDAARAENHLPTDVSASLIHLSMLGS